MNFNFEPFFYLILLFIGIYFAWNARTIASTLITIGMVIYIIPFIITLPYSVFIAQVALSLSLLGVLFYAGLKSKLDFMQRMIILIIILPVAANLMANIYQLDWYNMLQYPMLISCLVFLYVLLWDTNRFAEELGFLTLIAGIAFYTLLSRPFW